MNRTLLQQASDALVSRCGTNADEQRDLIPALRAELAKPEPEPVGWLYDWYADDDLVQNWFTSVFSETLDKTLKVHNVRPLFIKGQVAERDELQAKMAEPQADYDTKFLGLTRLRAEQTAMKHPNFMPSLFINNEGMKPVIKNC